MKLFKLRKEVYLMKKYILFLFVMIAALLLSSCTSSKLLNQGGTTSQGQTNGNADTGNTSPPDIAIGENMQWPSSQLGNLPQLNGKVTAVYKDNQSNSCIVSLSDCIIFDAAAYIAKLKSLGYVNGMDMSDGNGYLYYGTNSENNTATFTYTISTKEASITYTPGSGLTAVNATVSTTADMTDLAPWPSNFIKGVPELAGKITDVENSNNTLVTISLDYVAKADVEAYIQKLKQNGYTVDADETTSVNSIIYKAYNTDGEWVNVNFSVYSSGNTAYVEMEKPDSDD